jgi:N-acetylmuramoyl-L-alanine amidase
VSDYDGTDGISRRNNLAGLNLTTVPKVLVECANMQNPTDAALTESPAWRQLAANGLADGITRFLEAEEAP